MSYLMAIGEALIDFIPEQSGRGIKDVEGFAPIVGGAPANVCGAFVKLGGQAEMITQLGDDPFGDKIVADFEKNGIGCQFVRRTDKANTSLAFVALKEDGNREFSFYRKPGADMLYEKEYIQETWFQDCYALHFCSVSLGDFPMKEAHERAIACAEQAGAIISFDPNLRKQLWDDEGALYQAVQEFLPKAHILKVSDEELEFITKETDFEKGIEKLFQGNVELVVYTAGADGAKAFTRNTSAKAEGVRVKALDTTGAGDAFIGSFLHVLYENGIKKEDLNHLTEEQMRRFLDFSNHYCAKSVQKKGAIASYPTKEEMA